MVKRDKRAKAGPLEKLPGFENAKKFYFRLQSWRDGAQIVLTALSSLCFTVTGVIGLKGIGELFWKPAMLWPVTAVALAGLLVWGRFHFFKPTYDELLESRALLVDQMEQHRKALQSVLDTLANQLLDYTCKDSYDCRISTYSVEGLEFLLLSRNSLNPSLEPRGRAAYPMTGGNIGQAWAKGWVIQDHESTDRNEWEEALVAAGLFTAETASGLTMQSRSIYAQRIDRGPDKVGMIVFECENPGRFDEATRRKVQRSLILKAIAEILWESHVHFPRAVQRKQELAAETQVDVLPEPEWKRSPVKVEDRPEEGPEVESETPTEDEPGHQGTPTDWHKG